MYIYIYNAEINDRVLLFSELRVSCCLRNNLRPNELQRSNLLQHNVISPVSCAVTSFKIRNHYIVANLTVVVHSAEDCCASSMKL